MNTLANLTDTNPGKKTRKRVGRGPGSGLGKTSRRGQKGQGARSGYKRRHGQEGGQVPLYRKMPTRGFSNAQFRRALTCINLGQIERMFENGETVTQETLRQKGWISGKCHGIKILAEGELTKSVTIEADAYSASARKKLEAGKIDHKVVGS